MAGPLTWRDVSAPDFSTAMQGFGRFNDMLATALQGIDRGIGRFDNAQSDIVNKEAMSRILAQNDAAQLETGLQDKSLLGDLNQRRLSIDTLKAADQRVGNLLERDSMEQRVAKDKYDFTNLVDRDNARAAATPQVMALFNAANAGDAKAMAQIKADPALSKLKYQDLIDINRDAQGAYSTGISDRTNLQNMGQSATRFEREGTEWDQKQLSYQEGRDADALVINATGVAQGDPNMLADYIRGSSASDHVKYAALQRANLGGGMAAPGGGGATGGAGGSLGPGAAPTGSADSITRGFNYVAKDKGYAAMPASITTQGQARDYQQTMNNNKVKETAVGLYQIVGTTREEYAKKAFGDGWRNMPLSAQTDDLIAKAIFDDPRNRSVKAIRGRWVGLNKYSDKQVAAILQMPWEEAREYISKVESPGGVSAGAVLAMGSQNAKTPAETKLQAAANLDVLDDESGRSANNYNTRMLNAGLTTNTSPIGAATAAAKRPEFAGVPASELLTEMNGIMKKTAIGDKQGANQEQALLILENSLRPATKLEKFDAFGLFSNATDLRIDEDLLEKNIKEFGTGKYLDARDATRQRVATGEEVKALSTRRLALQERITRYERASLLDKNPGIAQTLSQLREELAFVDSQIGAVGQKVNGPDPAALLVNTAMGAVTSMARGNRPAPAKKPPVEKAWERALSPKPAPQAQQGWLIQGAPPLLQRRR